MRGARLDLALVERGLFASREQAKRAIMAGCVTVDGQRLDKPAAEVRAGADLAVLERDPFVSRGGHKLAAALAHYGIVPTDAVALDVGAATGGFTDCLLQRGARRVYALDVGHGLLAARLRSDPRVVVLERLNARHLGAGQLPEPVDLITVDVSFISLRLVVPALLPHLRRDGSLLPMVKPQFEAGREQVAKGGVVRDETVRVGAIDRLERELHALGLETLGRVDNRVLGPAGNRECFLWLRWAGQPGSER